MEGIKAFTPTAEEYQKYYSCKNEVGNGWFSWLASRGEFGNYAAGVWYRGGIIRRGRDVDVVEGGHSPALKINRNSEIFKSLAANCELAEGNVILLGQKHDLSKDWGKGECDIPWAMKQHHGKEVEYWVELAGKDDVIIRPTLPIAFACLYKSGVFGKGECTADKVNKWMEEEFVRAIEGLSKGKTKASERGPLSKEEIEANIRKVYGKNNKSLTIGEIEEAADMIHDNLDVLDEIKAIKSPEFNGIGIRERQKRIYEAQKALDTKIGVLDERRKNIQSILQKK